MVAPGLHFDSRVGPPQDYHALHARTLQQRLVHGRLQPNLLAAPPAAIGGDDQCGVQVLNARFHASEEKPPKTTLCVTPMRAHASMATIASGTIGM